MTDPTTSHSRTLRPSHQPLGTSEQTTWHNSLSFFPPPSSFSFFFLSPDDHWRRQTQNLLRLLFLLGTFVLLLLTFYVPCLPPEQLLLRKKKNDMFHWYFLFFQFFLLPHLIKENICLLLVWVNEPFTKWALSLFSYQLTIDHCWPFSLLFKWMTYSFCDFGLGYDSVVCLFTRKANCGLSWIKKLECSQRATTAAKSVLSSLALAWTESRVRVKEPWFSSQLNFFSFVLFLFFFW